MELRFYVKESFVKEYHDMVHIFTAMEKLFGKINYLPKIKMTVVFQDNRISFIFSHPKEDVLREVIELMKKEQIIQLDQPAALNSEVKSFEQLQTAKLKQIGRISIKYDLCQEK